MSIFTGNTVFDKNSNIYEEIVMETVPHKVGYFILAPSGAGKTFFVKNQKEKNWIDGDLIWTKTGAHPEGPWWTMGLEIINEIDARSDVITSEAKRRGLWILGASNSWLIPDAVVLPLREKNIEYIKIRQEGEYDGGLKLDQISQLDSHREWIKNIAEKNNVPIFESIADATSYIMNKYKEIN